MRNIILLFLLLFMSCASLKSAQKLKQGINGTILLKQGNQMPGPGRTLSPGQPVIREVAVYQLTNLSEAKSKGANFYEVKTALVTKTRSNAKGYFEVRLPVGRYSVFVVEKEGLYANEQNGEGNINPITVVSDSLTHKDIYLTNKAFF